MQRALIQSQVGTEGTDLNALSKRKHVYTPITCRVVVDVKYSVAICMQLLFHFLEYVGDAINSMMISIK